MTGEVTKNNDRHVEILIVEDSPTQADELKYILERKGYLVSSASNGKEALALMTGGFIPDIVISDVLMPEMDGFELCKRIRAADTLKNIPVILVTSLSDPKDVIRGLECGANNFVVKPYEERYLTSRIQYLMANASLRNNSKAEMGIHLYFSGENYFITAERLQILDLLLSTYETAYYQNYDLQKSQQELKDVNERLESANKQLEGYSESAMQQLQETQEKLFKAAQEWRNTFDSMADAMALVDREGRIMRCNKSMARLFNKPFADIIGLPHYLLFGHAEEPENCVVRKMRESRRKERADEQRGGRWFDVSADPLFGDKGEVAGAVFIMADITERKMMEDAIKKSRDFHLTLFDKFPSPIWRAGPDKKCDYFNRTWLEFTGRTLEQELGDGWTEGVHPDDLAKCSERYVRAFDLREPFEMEYRLRHRSGEYRWLVDFGRPYYDLDGSFGGYIGACFDITDRKNADEKIRLLNADLERKVLERTANLERATVMAEAASKAKSDFLANMSHELRTPLNSIIGFSEAFEDAVFGELNQKQLETVGYIRASGRHLLNLINDILDLSKVEAGKMELELAVFPLREALEDSLVLLKEKAMKHGIALDLDIEPGAEGEVEADERKFKQVMFNLLSNAVKFTQEGGSVRVSARVIGDGSTGLANHRSKIHGDFLEISVRDTGIGIKPEDMAKLFHEFSQVQSGYTREHEGTGLGLALTKKLVELHGGTIRALCEPGKGCTFIFEIPARLNKEEAAAA